MYNKKMKAPKSIMVLLTKQYLDAVRREEEEIKNAKPQSFQEMKEQARHEDQRSQHFKRKNN
jgi:hypothetical protein